MKTKKMFDYRDLHGPWEKPDDVYTKYTQNPSKNKEVVKPLHRNMYK